ncbi:MAG: hypothetical protein NT062_09925, partial [Proteobacteria bacterium]|nr:hypothetical protein [Pseudomonadota bacterium]
MRWPVIVSFVWLVACRGEASAPSPNPAPGQGSTSDKPHATSAGGATVAAAATPVKPLVEGASLRPHR